MPNAADGGRTAEATSIAGAMSMTDDRSRASFPPEDDVTTASSARLIRLTLEDGAPVYGFLSARQGTGRHLRMTQRRD